MINVKEYRSNKGVKGETLAKIIGVNKATYSKKENEQVRFSLEEARTIANYFKDTIESVFFNS